MFPYGFWDSPLWKEAARAGLRRISQMVSQGNIAGASQLATTPGVLKPSAAGSQIKHLGRGSEGLASLVAHPEHGVAVRKLYDPRGISTPEMIARKGEVGRAMNNDPNFAKFLGSAQTPQGGGTMHFNEYVHQAPQQRPLMPTNQQKLQGQQEKWRAEQTASAARKSIQDTSGYQGHDIRRGNMAIDSTTGQHKVIDFLPGKSSEGIFSDSDAPSKLMVMPGSSGAQLFNRSPNQSTTKGMLGGMLGGQVRNPATGGHMPAAPKPMGVRRNAGVSAKNTLVEGGVGNAPMRAAPVSPKPAATQVGYGSGTGAPSQSTQVMPAATPAPAPSASSNVATSVSSPSAMARPTVKPQQPPSTAIKYPPPAKPLSPPKPKPPTPVFGPGSSQQQRTQVLGT